MSRLLWPVEPRGRVGELGHHRAHGILDDLFEILLKVVHVAAWRAGDDRRQSRKL